MLLELRHEEIVFLDGVAVRLGLIVLFGRLKELVARFSRQEDEQEQSEHAQHDQSADAQHDHVGASLFAVAPTLSSREERLPMLYWW